MRQSARSLSPMDMGLRVVDGCRNNEGGSCAFARNPPLFAQAEGSREPYLPLVWHIGPLDKSTDDTDEPGVFPASTLSHSRCRLGQFLWWVRMRRAFGIPRSLPRGPQKKLSRATRPAQRRRTRRSSPLLSVWSVDFPSGAQRSSSGRTVQRTTPEGFRSSGFSRDRLPAG